MPPRDNLRNSGWFILLSGVGASLLASCSTERPDFSMGSQTGGAAMGGGDSEASGGKTNANDSGGSGATGGLGGRKGETSDGDGGDGSGGRVSGCSTDPSACENDTDECSPNPCKNGAACSDDGDGFTCACPAGFEGELCKSNIDECEDSPCKNGGTCTDGVASYSCDCTGTGYEGDTCDTPLVQQLAVPPGASSCEVVGVSDGGTVIAANCQMGGDTFGDPYFWEAGEGWTAAQRASGYSVGYLVGLSADGSTAVGNFRDSGPDYPGVWTSTTTPASLLSHSIGGGVPATAISASGNAVIGTDSGGEMLRWMPLTAPEPENWGIGSGSGGVAISGNGKVLVAGGTGPYNADGGYGIWTSTTENQEFSSAARAYPRFASQDGSTFVYLSDAKVAHVVRNGQTTYHNDCLPAGLSSDGRRMLAACADALRLFRDGTGVDVQTLIDYSGASYTLPSIPTDGIEVPVRFSWDGYYIALGVSSKVVLMHLQE